MPRVPPGGLQENSRKLLQHKRKCTNQILKAAMAINSNALAEMDVPVSYLDSLPKVEPKHEAYSYHIRWLNYNAGSLITEREGEPRRCDASIHHFRSVLRRMPSGLPRVLLRTPSSRNRQPPRGIHLHVASESRYKTQKQHCSL